MITRTLTAAGVVATATVTQHRDGAEIHLVASGLLTLDQQFLIYCRANETVEQCLERAARAALRGLAEHFEEDDPARAEIGNAMAEVKADG